MEQLPSEIRQKIFESLPKPTLYQCLFVSRRWFQTTAQLIYKDIKVNDANIDKLLSTLTHNESFQQYGHWTKTLCCVEISSKFLSEPDLLALLSYLPNLKTIDVVNSKNFDYYMTILNKKSIKLNSLERIMSKPHNASWPMTRSNQKLYFYTLHRYRDSLTDVSICYNSDSRYFRRTNVDILQVLLQFHCLTRLTLSNVVDEHLTIFYLLSLYPQLVDLDFASAYPVPDDVAEKQLLNLSNQKTLKSLRLDVPVVTPAYIRYITYFTAPDMDTIRLKMSRTNFFNWIDNMGSDTVIQLAQRMSKASNACISTYARSEQRPFQCNRSKMTRFYQILHALKGSRQLQCQGVFAECHSSEVLINIHQNYFLEFEYSLNSQDFEDGDGEDDDVGLVLPDRSISRIGPEIINSCSFQLSRRVKCVPHSLVKTALMHCPYLYHFQVKYNTHTFGALLEAGTPSTNRIKKIQQTTDQITQLLFKKGTVLSKKLTLILVKYLPNINVCKFNEVQLLTERVSLNSIIDLSGFKHLDTCYFDIASIARLIKLKCLDQIFIRFDYLDSARVDWFQVQGSDNEYRRSNTCPYTVTAAENDYVQQCLVDNLSKKCVVTYRCSQIPNAFDILAPLYPILQLSHGQQKNAV